MFDKKRGVALKWVIPTVSPFSKDVDALTRVSTGYHTAHAQGSSDPAPQNGGVLTANC